ncbi:hypothetical protein ACCAA_430054 [Candidatus Accumulibacter aalborgensis]|uniref:Uncharacterized protein n=1 Tax=Candidatus Accumulibacter aalborgensis TaxID=1860102 RepID=A0A1A8XQP1_9PROT|nr:hypothetical protein ACCAA_430054 [Candidatus Accumulibacter aalborgensis]
MATVNGVASSYRWMSIGPLTVSIRTIVASAQPGAANRAAIKMQYFQPKLIAVKAFSAIDKVPTTGGRASFPKRLDTRFSRAPTCRH